MKLKKILHLSVVASLTLVLLTACQGELYTPDSAAGQETDDYVEVRVEALKVKLKEHKILKIQRRKLWMWKKWMRLQ